MPRLLVVGLGNPGEKYLRTRHNLGFLVLDRLLEKAGSGEEFAADRRREALYARVPLAGRPALLVKPQTFVNRSGRSVGAFSAWYRVPPSRVIVVCDDLALPFGKLRLRDQGSSGGHNGLQSVIEAIGAGYPRLRIGIGSPEESREWKSHVLGPFSPGEEKELPGLLDRAVDEITVFVGSLEGDS